MSGLPSLENWVTTKQGLHLAAQVVGALRKAQIEPLPNALHLSLFVTEKGLTTGLLPNGNEFVLDFAHGAVDYHRPDGSVTSVALAGQTQATLLAALTQDLPAIGEHVSALAHLDSPDVFSVDAQLASDYADALNTVYTAIARFRAHLFGTLSPAVVWPHGFDLSFLYFKGFAPDEKTQPHLNFGFSPGSDGFPRPYLYTYAWPWPEGITEKPLPAPARWYTATWRGAIVDYDALLGHVTDAHSAQTVIESLVEGIYRQFIAAW